MTIVVKGKNIKGIYRIYAYIKSSNLKKPIFLGAKFLGDLLSLFDISCDAVWGKEFESEYHFLRKE